MKAYVKPTAEKVEFEYANQVVASGGGAKCEIVWKNVGIESCQSGTPEKIETLYENMSA